VQLCCKLFINTKETSLRHRYGALLPAVVNKYEAILRYPGAALLQALYNIPNLLLATMMYRNLLMGVLMHLPLQQYTIYRNLL